ncbi:MAG: hypothetical protein QXS81_00965 [Candidatus Micrarchaeaceae archaeon]
MTEITKMSKKSGKKVEQISKTAGEIFRELSAETGKKANKLYARKKLRS